MSKVISNPQAYIQKLEQFFNGEEPHYLNEAEASAWIFTLLLEKGEEGVYGMGLMDELPQRFPKLEISDTMLYQAIDSLLFSGIITKTEEKKVAGRGRPRKVYRLKPSYKEVAKIISGQWIDRIKSMGLS